MLIYIFYTTTPTQTGVDQPSLSYMESALLSLSLCSSFFDFDMTHHLGSRVEALEVGVDDVRNDDDEGEGEEEEEDR